ncbi:MAG: M23 family metallopeptidase [Deltaproteobacteria bacterium]|nr:M23 family metallopeptidase [Deltaproteobacteria bacterium]
MRYLIRLLAAALLAAALGAVMVTVAMRTWPQHVQVNAGWHGPIAAPPLDDLRVTSSFGRRGGSFHAGVDLRARSGTPVRAVDDGVVAKARHSKRAGKHVVLALDSGWRAGYAHLSRIDVEERERVRAGQRIGLSGATGRASGPHLHFELRAPTGKLVDPMAWLRAGRRALG